MLKMERSSSGSMIGPGFLFSMWGERSYDAIYPKGVPDDAEAVAQDNKIIVTVGQPVEHRTKRRVELIGR